MTPADTHELSGFPDVIKDSNGTDVWYTAGVGSSYKRPSEQTSGHALIIHTTVPNSEKTLFINDLDNPDPKLSITRTQLRILQDSKYTGMLDHGVPEGGDITIVLFSEPGQVLQVFLWSDAGRKDNMKFRSAGGAEQKGSWWGGVKANHVRHTYRAGSCHKWYRTNKKVTQEVMDLVLGFFD